MKILTKITILFFSVVMLLSGTFKTDHASSISGNTTGCSCHGTAVKSASNIFLTGLPTSVVAGTKYPISLTIADPNGKIWGFDLGVATGNGVFSTTNPNAKATTSGKEVRHYNGAPVQTASSYTFDSIFWTAPATAGSVTFSYAGLAGNNNGSSGGDKVYKSSVTIPVTLPVNFKSIQVQELNHSITVKWITSEEININHYEIEMSNDGFNFKKIGEKKPITENQMQHEYAFVDNLNHSNASTIYYRVKNIDNNGAFSYSDVYAWVNKVENSEISIYPNPVKSGKTSQLKIPTHLIGKQLKLAIINMEGKCVAEQNFIPIVNTWPTANMIQNLKSGIYFFTISNQTDWNFNPLVTKFIVE